MLSIKNLEAGYGKVKVLHGINIEVPKGQVISLIGSNGAGKTTTMRAITGMIKPEAGEVILGGVKIDGFDSHKIARLGLAHSPEGRRVFSTMSVTDNLLLGAFPRLTYSRPKGDVKGDLERAMDLFPRLKERRNQLAGTLSGGEQQMLAISRALMSRPKLLLLDEPSLGLAPLIVKEIFAVIRRVRDEGVTILLVEQMANQALKVSDRAYVLKNGLIVTSGSAKDIANDPAVREAYLGKH